MSKVVIAVDIDEVLAGFISCLSKYLVEIEEAPGDLTAESFHSYEFHLVLGCTVEHCNKLVNSFFDSDLFHGCIAPIEGAKPVLLRLKELGFDLHIVTARHDQCANATRAWIDRYYYGIFTELHFGNHYSKNGRSRKKSEICAAIGASLLIDDAYKYAQDCALNRIPCVLYGDYGWNRGDFSEEHAPFVKRVASWSAVEEAVVSLLHTHPPALTPTPAVAEAETVASSVAAISSSSSSGSVVVVVKKSPLIAVAQMRSSNDKKANISNIVALIGVAASRGARLVSLPEACIFMGESLEQSLAAAESMPSVGMDAFGAEAHGCPSLKDICASALANQVWVAIGGYACICAESEEPDSSSGSGSGSGRKIFNLQVIINPQGIVASHYAKMHLFDSPVSGLMESDTTTGGQDCVCIDMDGIGRVGLSICYDMRFPEYFWRLREMGASVILVPSAFTTRTGNAHWEVLLRARAIDTQCYIAAAAQAGKHNANSSRESYGHTMCVDPWGTVVSACGSEEQNSLCYLEVDTTRLQTIRDQMPLHTHRRAEYYASK